MHRGDDMKYFKLCDDEKLLRIDMANENVSSGVEISQEEYYALLCEIKSKIELLESNINNDIVEE